MIEPLAARLADARRALGVVATLTADVLQRDRPLGIPGAVSPNGSCRMVRTADGWIAVNLPRSCDAELVPAWLEQDIGDGDPWPAIVAAARRLGCSELEARAELLGLAGGTVGSIAPTGVRSVRMGPTGNCRRQVIDLSALWAGPLCAGLLAQSGFAVTKVACVNRPDPIARSTPEHDRRLNGRKQRIAFDFADRARLHALVAQADIVVFSARPRALAGLGIDLSHWFRARAGRIWVSVTAYGWSGAGSDRIGFGDDAAAAGGLVDWVGGAPRFAGDALADPLTGIAAAAAALEAVRQGGGVLIDAALARVAAQVQQQRVTRCAA
ncbi:CoA transferase [Sphingomonas sp. IC4-52]|uniref:CoA transferase n=1 Tax=Sphingomonas sp. IC4-52 TaxID=2887202 RepID=UPI001D125141|nr:CoA transferase [Sphingomonas sp. IC4-52]MCC2980280.1 CoA transferase [Sphingomonas sp. IC4-52]